MSSSIKSKQRVADFGEVLTPPHIVDAMLDLVKPETERIDSRFLEPACGTGNFLIEILRRKLQMVEKRYRKSQLDYERYAVLAVSSLYGIDILSDNVEECRNRLFQAFDAAYTAIFGGKTKAACRETVRFILRRNIIHGDALTLRTVGENPQPIIFSEWSLVNGSLLKRRDFAFHELVHHASMRELPLFSDQGEEVFIPEPVQEYPPVHFLELSQLMDMNQLNEEKETANERELLFKDEVYAVVGAAMEVANELGSGFLEGVYQEALAIEFKEREIPFTAQPPVGIIYKGHKLVKEYFPDFICFDRIVVEIKAIKQLTSVEEAQLLNYLKASGKPVGVLLNFGAPKLEWKRMVLSMSREGEKQ